SFTASGATSRQRSRLFDARGWPGTPCRRRATDPLAERAPATALRTHVPVEHVVEVPDTDLLAAEEQTLERARPHAGLDAREVVEVLVEDDPERGAARGVVAERRACRTRTKRVGPPLP